MTFFSPTSTAVIGPGLDQERDDLAQETEAEEVAVTMRDVAPETESVQADSEPVVMTTCPSLPISIPTFFFLFKFVLFQIHSRTNWKVPDFEAVTALMNLFFISENDFHLH